MGTLDILTALVKGGMTPVAACAMGGNMMAESSMHSNNLQNSCEKRLGLDDDAYTAEVDSGVRTREIFANDQVGYGLCQWTSPDRKRNLYDFAKSRGKSIGDEAMQTEFCVAELKIDYPSLLAYLCETKDMATAVSRICKEYERPAVNNIEARYKYAQQLYKDYGDILQTAYVEYVEMKDYKDPVGAQGACGLEYECRGRLMATVRSGEHTPEACFLMSHLVKLGYDVLWLGLDACLRDFQLRRGLEVTGVCGEETWREMLR